MVWGKEPRPLWSAWASPYGCWACEQGQAGENEKRAQVCGWNPADPACPMESHQGGTWVGPGRGLLLPPCCPGPPAQCHGGQRLERGSEQSKSRHPRPVTHSWHLELSSVLRNLELYGKLLRSEAWARPGPLHPPFSTQRLGQAAGESCWGHQMPSDRGSKDTRQQKLTAD